MINRKSRLLVLDFPFVLALKKKGEERYSLIGGNIEENETALKSMLREAKEEAGIKIKLKDLSYCGLLTEEKLGVLHERNYFILSDNRYNFMLNEPEKFEAIEWIDFFDNSNKFKKMDRKIIKAQFTSKEL